MKISVRLDNRGRLIGTNKNYALDEMSYVGFANLKSMRIKFNYSPRVGPVDMYLIGSYNADSPISTLHDYDTVRTSTGSYTSPTFYNNAAMRAAVMTNSYVYSFVQTYMESNVVVSLYHKTAADGFEFSLFAIGDMALYDTANGNSLTWLSGGEDYMPRYTDGQNFRYYYYYYLTGTTRAKIRVYRNGANVRELSYNTVYTFLTGAPINTALSMTTTEMLNNGMQTINASGVAIPAAAMLLSDSFNIRYPETINYAYNPNLRFYYNSGKVITLVPAGTFPTLYSTGTQETSWYEVPQATIDELLNALNSPSSYSNPLIRARTGNAMFSPSIHSGIINYIDIEYEFDWAPKQLMLDVKKDGELKKVIGIYTKKNGVGKKVVLSRKKNGILQGVSKWL